MDIDGELARVEATLRSGHDVLPFMGGLIDAGLARLCPLPHDMLVLLRGSTDFRELDPGGAPTWFQIAGPDDAAAELVVYRARSDEGYYVAAERAPPAD